MVTPRLLIFLILFAIFLPVASANAQERLCDTAFEDCRAPLWQLIDNETQGIDVSFWFMQDSSYATKIINRFLAIPDEMKSCRNASGRERSLQEKNVTRVVLRN